MAVTIESVKTLGRHLARSRKNRTLDDLLLIQVLKLGVLTHNDQTARSSFYEVMKARVDNGRSNWKVYYKLATDWGEIALAAIQE